MNLREFEDAVWATEGVRIVVRADEGAEVEEYDYANAANKNWRIGQLLENRVAPLLNGEQVVVIQGDGERPHGNAILQTIRASYGTGD